MDLFLNNRVKDLFINLKKIPNVYIQTEHESIPTDLLKQVSAWHNLDVSEKIEIVYYDSVVEKGSFFSAEKKIHFSTCITSSGISFSANIESKGWIKNDDAFIKVNWKEIEKATFAENVDLEEISLKPNTFFINNDPSINIKSNLDVMLFYSTKDHSCLVIPELYLKNVKLFSEFLNELLFVKNETTTLLNDQKSIVRNNIIELLNNEQYEELLSYVETNINSIDPLKVDYLKAIAYVGINDLHKAENHYHTLKNAYNNIDKNSEEYNKISRYYYLGRAEIKKIKGEAYDSAVSFMQVQELEKSKENKDYNFINQLEKKSIERYNDYVSNFIDYKYNERKVITISDNKLFKGELTSVLNINNLPEIQFPTSHPQVDQTYICHPHNQTIYIPLENYEKELLDDRINEYCFLLQCLGATSISIVNVNSEKTTSDEIEIQKKGVKLDISKEVIAAGHISSGTTAPLGIAIGKYGDRNLGLGDDTGSAHSSITDKEESSNSTLEKTQYFNPTKKPYIPDNLTWFSKELSWQRIAQQRLEGNLLTHNEFISTTQNQVINHSEFNKLNVDLNLLVASTGMNRTNLDKYNSTLNTSESWRIEVNFKPLEELESGDPVMVVENKSEKLNENDQNYLEEILSVLEDDLEISEKDEVFLKRYRQKFNISDARDLELRKIAYDSLQPKFTEDELEYLEDLESIVGNDLEIDEKSRKRLNKLSSLLDISEARITEIEEIYFKSIK